MTLAERTTLYQGRHVKFFGQLRQISRKINLVSNARLVVAIVLGLLIYLAFSTPTVLYYTPGAVVLFAVLMQYHGALFEKQTILKNLVSIQLQELQAQEGNLDAFDKGTAFTDSHHSYTYDLDIFGDGSLFQYVNRCPTPGGRKKLAERFSNHLTSVEEVRDTQHAVRELAAKIDFCHHFRAAGMNVEENANDRRQLVEWSTVKNFVFGKTFFKIVLTLLPVITITLLVLGFLVDGFAKFFWMAAATQWAILALHLKRVNYFHQFVSNKKNLLLKYSDLLGILQRERIFLQTI